MIELFGDALWLWLGVILLGIVLWFITRTNRSRRRALEALVSQRQRERLVIGASTTVRRVKEACWIIAIVCFCVALARPRGGFTWEEFSSKGIDFLIAVDVSKSMLAQDVRPNRLERARLAILDLVQRLHGDRVGLIVFAGEAFLQCPPTSDYDAFIQTLELLSPELITRGGTDLRAAISEARRAFSGAAGSEKVVILLTDGEDLEGGALDAAKAAGRDGIRIFTVGVGTSAGELIPVPSESGGVDFARDASGQFVKSRLDEPTLQAIAAAARGKYFPLGSLGDGLEKLYRQELATLPQREGAARREKIYRELFQIPLAIGILLLMIEWLLVERPRTTPGKKRWWWRARRGSTLILMGTLMAAVSTSSVHATTESDALAAYRKKKFAAAEKLFTQAADETTGGSSRDRKATLAFNAGAAAYQAKNWAAAADQFARALQTEDPKLQQNAYYNLGNAAYRAGESTGAQNRTQTIAQWQKALQYYRAALALNKDDTQAKENEAFVRKKLEELQKQPPPQQQEQQPQKQKPQPQPNPSQPQNPPPSEQKSKSPQPKSSSDSQQQAPQPQQKNQQQQDPGEQESQEKNKPSGAPPSGSDSRAGSQSQNAPGGNTPSPNAPSSPASSGTQNQNPPPPNSKPSEASARPDNAAGTKESGGRTPDKTGKIESAGQAGSGKEKSPASAQSGGIAEMSAAEAEQFLDSQKNEESILVPASQSSGTQEPPKRDW